MRKVISIFTLVLLYVVVSYGQAIDIPITISDNAAHSKVLNFGLDLTATDGIDPALGESDLPPFPFGFEARFILPGGVLSSYKDYRNAPAFPFTGVKAHVLKYQVGDGGGTEIDIAWNMPTGVSGHLYDQITGTLINQTLTGTGSYAITSGGFLTTALNLDITYTNVGPASPGPVFSMTPPSLNFGTVGVPGSSMLPVTVSNPGTTNALQIDSAVSSNPRFTFSPNTFPIVVAALGNQVFNVTFTPIADGAQNGTITFYHNAPGSPTVLNVSGTGQTQGGLLKFISPVRDITDNSSNNADTVVLSGYSGQPLKALQFNVLVGNPQGGLILNSVSRGAAIPAGQFNFSYQIYTGAFLPDGSSIDTLKVVILGNGTNEIAPGGSDKEILRFSYNAVPISGVSFQTHNSLAGVVGATSTPVVNANISTGAPETVNIYNGVIGVGLLGDVNLDNNVNILDILLMIDYILGRVTFTAQQFAMGDIAPWVTGNPLPTTDGVIDVLDLAVLQNIVLTGVYPSGLPVNKIATTPVEFTSNGLNKLTPGMNAKVTFYLTGAGITVGLESIKKVKGLQMELDQLSSIIPQNTQMTSVFDQAVFYQKNSFLRMLSYDGQSNPLNAGQFIVADVPFSLVNVGDITVENVIVADENDEAMQKVEIEIKYESPSVPLDYMLSQNFPNPFNPTTMVQFSVPKDQFVTISVFDMLGQEVTSLYSGNAKAGIYTLNWNGLDHSGKQVSSGSYIYRMTAGDFVQSKKMMFIK